MKIELVHLENIRSHVKSTVPFAHGFNCLVGGLGCGKSSVLYAVDFALWGDPISRSYDYLLREGTDCAKVTVQFTHGGKSYVLTRALKRRGKSINQDSDELKLIEDNNVVASVKSDAVVEQIKSITGLTRDLFYEIVWIRQEHLKELLNVQPRERQRRLDDLFGLSDYETAWSNIVQYQKGYEGERRAYEKDADVIGLDKISRECDQATEHLALVMIQIEEISTRLSQAETSLQDADTELKRLEEVRVRNEDLKRREAAIIADINGTREALGSLNRRLKEKKEVIEEYEIRLSSLRSQKQTYIDELSNMGISIDQPPDVLKQRTASFEDNLAALKSEFEVETRNLETDKKRITSLSTESICPLCQQSLAPDYKKGLTKRLSDENANRVSRISDLRRQVGEQQRLRDRMNTLLSKSQILVPRIEEIEVCLAKESTVQDQLLAETAEKQREEDEAVRNLDSVRFEISHFDVSELESARKRRDQAFRNKVSLEADLRSKEAETEHLKTRTDELKARIDVAEQKLERVRKIESAIDIIGSLRDAYRSIQPRLRSEFVKILRSFVQQVLDSLVGGQGLFMNVQIDEEYSPSIASEEGVIRDVLNLSGGERTLLAFSYRLGLGQLIMQSRTGHGLSVLLLDEPTESLGTEDGSIGRLADAVSRFKAIEQTIAVTHNEDFADKAEHVIRMYKEAGVTRISVER